MINRLPLENWQRACNYFKKRFDVEEDLQTFVYLIGMQELGKIQDRFTKEEKLDIMNIGLCRLLSEFNYYRLVKTDNDGWPHYERIQFLPDLDASQSENLVKEAITIYLNKQGLID